MDGWWKKNPFYVEYMVHEGTALFVAAYAITLLVGLIRLGQGEAAWNGWLAAMQNPLAIVCHLAVLVAVALSARLPLLPAVVLVGAWLAVMAFELVNSAVVLISYRRGWHG